MALSYEYFIAVMIITSVAYLYPVLFILRHTVREVKNKKKTNVVNYVLSIMILLFILFSFYFIYANLYAQDDPLLEIYLNLIFYSIVVLWGLIVISSLIYKIFGDPSKLKKLNRQLMENNIKNPLMEDLKRKLFHILFYGMIWGGIAIMIFFTVQFDPRFAEPEMYQLRIWGYNSVNPTELFFYLRLVSGNSTFIDNPGVAIMFWFVFIIGGYISTTLEAIRNSKVLYFPTNQLITFLIRESEVNALASHFYLFLALSFSALVLPPLLVISIIGIVCIGDAAASQFGMRFGKRFKIKVNKKKSWIGTISGTIASFFASFIFVGLIYGIVSALIFAVIDIFTEEPIKISDNLSVPVFLTLIYLILNLSGVPYSYPSFLFV